MKNKDQLNQIPAKPELEKQDEKTSQTQPNNVEASPKNEPEQDSAIENTEALTNNIPSEIPELLPPDTSPEVASEAIAATETSPDEEKSSIENETEIANNPENSSQEPVSAPVEQLTEPAPAAELQEPPADAEEQNTSPDKVSGSVSETGEHEQPFDEDEEDEDIEHDEHAELTQLNYDGMTREELVKNLESLVNEEDVTKIKSRIALIKVAFLHKTKEFKETGYQNYLDEGGEKEDYSPQIDELEIRFNSFFDVYKQKRSVYLENLEAEKITNLKKKQDILEALKDLINSEETLKKTYDDFRELQEQWRQIGMVPKGEINNLWQNYHFLVEKFFDKVKINKELKDLDLKKNLEQKIELCEKVEELLLETSIIKSFKKLQQYHEQWKEIGPVPDDKKDEIWDRFKSTTDKINQRRRDHYKQLQEEQEANLTAKIALCEKAESLQAEEVTSIKGWQERTKQFNELFKMWKTIGQAPKRQNDEVWERFKASLDGFFTEKKEYFSKIKEQQVNNYNLKLELCLQAESLKNTDDWRNTTRELINLQKQWKEIGPVPRKYADKIWQRFREACDEFFNRKSSHFSEIRNEESDNLKKKEELISAVENQEFGGNKAKNLEILKDYQRQWTEIGFVPFKEKDRLQNAFRNAINEKLDQLNISNSEMTLSNYISRLDGIKHSPEGNRQLQREQNFIQNKIAELREDIMLWENNIGFLADTKNANVFKVEFEKKIERAKNELSMLESKLKILNK
ncbi:MAG: DUF349 domain-containing protein [Sphingobacteriia bacterium]|nr:DUF349 domain-containing protein [Sphingobacteriia bacterium]